MFSGQPLLANPISHREESGPAMQFNALLVRPELILILGTIVLLLAIERVLLHRRLMVELKHQARTSEEIEFNQPKFPFASIGVVLVGIGVGLAVHKVWAIILVTGISLFIWGALLDPFLSEYFQNKEHKRVMRTIFAMTEIKSGEDDGDDS